MCTNKPTDVGSVVLGNSSSGYWQNIFKCRVSFLHWNPSVESVNTVTTITHVRL